MKHGDEICPAYGLEVLPDEDGNCSLCGASFIDERIDCYECVEQHERGFSYPIDPKYKNNIKAHLMSHKDK